MDELEQGGVSEGMESGETEESAEHNQVVEENNSEATESKVEGENETSAEETENKDDIEAFVEKDGKKFIPYERFQQLNERMQKAEQAATLLDAIQTDPVAKAEFVKALGLDQKATETKADEPAPDAPFQAFLKSSVAPEHHGHYESMANAFHQVSHNATMKEVKSLLEPIMAALGGMKLAEVQKALPDFNKYQKEVHGFMKQFPGMTPEQAYTLASRNDVHKRGIEKGAKQTKEELAKKNKAPITKGNSVGSQGAKAPAKTFREAFDRGYNQHTGQ